MNYLGVFAVVLAIVAIIVAALWGPIYLWREKPTAAKFAAAPPQITRN